MENSTERKIIRNLNPNVGPTDGVSYGVKGTLTKFMEQKKRGRMIQTLLDCKIMASAECGTVSISMKDTKGIMMTVRLDEMIEVIAAALEAAKSNEMKDTKQEDN